MGKFSQTFWEFGTKAKASATTVHAADLTVGNIAAQEVLRDAFISAITAVSIGNPGGYDWLAESTNVAKVTATDEAAQRENKWLVSFSDTVTGLGGTFTIPCYDPALLALDGEEMESGAERSALVSAAEDFVLSNALNPIAVSSIRFSSRSR